MTGGSMPQTRRPLQRWLDRPKPGGPGPVGFSSARRPGRGVRETITVNGAPQRGQRSGSAGGAGGGCSPHGCSWDRQRSKTACARPLWEIGT